MGANKIKISLSLLLVLPMLCLSAQEPQIGNEIKPIIPSVKLGDGVIVKLGGFVRTEYFIDSRKMVGAVDDIFGFFPDKHYYDDDGNDLNNIVRKTFSTQASRFNSTFSGPDLLKAKPSAFFEIDFTGGNTINLRLRHAYVKLSWPKSETLIGKTWNPLAETVFPSVIGMDTGIPFRPFGRGDQIRITLKPSSKVNILAAAFFQSEHRSFNFTDAVGTVGQSYDNTRTNPIPDLHLQLHYKVDSFFAGLISEYKIVRPSTVSTGTNGTYKVNETVRSCSLGGFVRFTQNKLTIQGSSLYGQNLSELFQQGGYAVSSIDLINGYRSYTPSNSVASWLNATYGKDLVIGLFGGYQKNLGFSKNILSGAGTFLGRWLDIDHIYRLAPSIKYSKGRITLAAELDYNVAAYGTVDYFDKGKVKNADEISNVRGLISVMFLF
jgi:hypothetical protein